VGDAHDVTLLAAWRHDTHLLVYLPQTHRPVWYCCCWRVSRLCIGQDARPPVFDHQRFTLQRPLPAMMNNCTVQEKQTLWTKPSVDISHLITPPRRTLTCSAPWADWVDVLRRQRKPVPSQRNLLTDSHKNLQRWLRRVPLPPWKISSESTKESFAQLLYSCGCQLISDEYEWMNGCDFVHQSASASF